MLIEIVQKKIDKRLHALERNYQFNVSVSLRSSKSFFIYFLLVDSLLILYANVTAVSSGVSFVLSSILVVLLFSGMQMYKVWLSSSQLGTILGGLLGSLLFMCTLTAVGNLESSLFGKSFQQKLLPEGIEYL